MTAEQCRDRAAACATLASAARCPEVEAQYLVLVAQWRLMSIEAMYFGQPTSPVGA